MGERIIKFDEKYIGKKNNFLKVIAISRMPKNNHRAFLCECDCGNQKLVEPVFWEKGVVKSCGCKKIELLKKENLKHGLSGSRIYTIWNGMIERCFNGKTPSYKNYGARGIIVCEEWKNDFMTFRKWALENGYTEKLTIDRIDVNGNYEPSNCRWVDYKTQNNNRRPRSEWKERELKQCCIDGEIKPLKEWYIIYKTSAQTVRYRMKTMGMTFEEALKTPKLTGGRPKK